jgi:uncharacterized membrane protein (DUF2068 family)
LLSYGKARIFVPMAAGRTTLGLKIIGIWKLLTALLLAAAGFGILHLLGHQVRGDISQFITQLHLDPEKGMIHSAIAKITGINPGKLKKIGVGTFFYAALHAVEGIGLLFAMHWAEYLTILATGSLIPIEVYEVIMKLTAMRVLVLAGNIAIVVYLIGRLRRDRGAAA